MTTKGIGNSLQNMHVNAQSQWLYHFYVVDIGHSGLNTVGEFEHWRWRRLASGRRRLTRQSQQDAVKQLIAQHISYSSIIRYLLIIRLPDDGRKAFMFCLCPFLFFNTSQTKVSLYHRFGPRLNSWNWPRHFAHLPWILQGGGQKVRNMVSIFDQSRVWHIAVSKWRNTSEI